MVERKDIIYQYNDCERYIHKELIEDNHAVHISLNNLIQKLIDNNVTDCIMKENPSKKNIIRLTFIAGTLSCIKLE